MALTCKKTLLSMNVGDYIWCKYQAPSGLTGEFSDIGNIDDSMPSWNPNDRSSTSAILSYKNLKVTMIGNTNTGIRANVGKSSGKWYWELTIEGYVSASFSVGIANAMATIASSPGYSTTGIEWRSGGNFYYNNASIATTVGFTTGDVLGFELDKVSNVIRFYKNGSLIYTDSTRLSTTNIGTVFPMVGIAGTSSTGTVYANFGDRAFEYTPTSGYIAFDKVSTLLGTLGTQELNKTDTATPNGYFRFIKVDEDCFKRSILVADRAIQNTISLDKLNTIGWKDGGIISPTIYLDNIYQPAAIAGAGTAVDFSPVFTNSTYMINGLFMAIGHINSPYVSIYRNDKVNGFTKLSNPGTLPTGNATSVKFSYDNNYLAVAHPNSPYITIYKITNNTFTKLDNLPNLPSDTCRGVTFSPNVDYLVACSGTTPYVVIYKRSGDTFTKLDNPGTLPTGIAICACFSEDNTYLVVGNNTTPFITIYKRSGDTFTALSSPGTLPTSIVRGVGFSPDGNYLAVAHDNSPYITVYKRSGDTFTKLGNPGTLPTGNGGGIAWTSDNKHILISHNVTPFITIYKLDGDVLRKITNPNTLPAGDGYGIAASSDGFVTVACGTTPYFRIYKRDLSIETYSDIDNAGTSIRLLSGGETDAEGGNEWDNYIVRSFLQNNNPIPVYSTSIATPNMLSGKTVSGVTVSTGSEYGSPYNCNNAFDRDKTSGGGWYTLTSDTNMNNAWVKIDFGNGVTKRIGKISLFGIVSSYRNVKLFKILYSSDNTNWTEAYCGEATNVTAEAEQIFSWDQVDSYRYWKFEYTSYYTGSNASYGLLELEMYEQTGYDTTIPKNNIIAGDNAVWNCNTSTVGSWCSSTDSVSLPPYYTCRGFGGIPTSRNFGGSASNLSSSTQSFRPVLVVETLFTNANPTDTLVMDYITTHNTNLNLTGNITDTAGETAKYKITLNSVTKVDWTELASVPVAVDYDVLASDLSIGENTLLIEYEDMYEATGSHQFTITKTNSNPTDTLDVDRTARHTESVTISGNISDSDGDTVKYRVLLNASVHADWTSLAASPVAVSHTFTNAELGQQNNTIKVEYEDMLGGTGYHEQVITFENTNPVVSVSANTLGILTNTIYLTGNITEPEGDTVRYRIEKNSVEIKAWTSLQAAPLAVSESYVGSDFNLGSNNITIYAEDNLGGTANKSFTIIKKDWKTTYIDSANTTTNYFGENQEKISTSETMLVSAGTYDENLGYIESAILNLKMKTQATGSVKVAKILSSWNEVTVTYATKPTIDTDNAITVNFTNTAYQNIDVLSLFGEYGVALYTESGSFLIDSVGNDSDLVYKPTVLFQPANANADGIILLWEPVVFGDLVEANFTWLNVIRSEASNFTNPTTVYQTTESEVVSYEDTDVVASKTYYYKVQLLFNDYSEVDSNIVEVATPADLLHRYKWNGTSYDLEFVEGLMFHDSLPEYYSTNKGLILKYLELPLLYAGQESNPIMVTLENTFDSTVTNVLVTADIDALPEGCSIKFSLAESPFEDLDSLEFSSIATGIENDFYIKLYSTAFSSGEGTFDIRVKGTV